MQTIYRYLILTALFVTGIVVAGCDSQDKGKVHLPRGNGLQQSAPTLNTDTRATTAAPGPGINQQVKVDHSRYLFVIEEHSEEELNALLTRAEEISHAASEDYQEVDIALVIHGPSANYFAEGKPQTSERLINLAARLDASKVIDLKICEASMVSQGIRREQVPTFIESVPFAPDEIKRLTDDGYTTL